MKVSHILRCDQQLFFVFLAAFFIVTMGGCSAPLYKGPSSDHFDGQSFFNKESDHTFGDMVKWLWGMDLVAWPEWIDDPPQPKPIAYVSDGELKITFINHGTVLMQMDGVPILSGQNAPDLSPGSALKGFALRA